MSIKRLVGFILLFAVMATLLLAITPSPHQADGILAPPVPDRTPDSTLSNLQVIKMAQEKIDDSIIINVIKSSTPSFDLTPDGIIKLSKSGVSATIIRAMQERQSSVAKPDVSTATGNQKRGEPDVVSRSNQSSKNSQPRGVRIDDSHGGNQSVPVYGSADDLKGLFRVYVHADDAESRERVIATLRKKSQYQIVGDPSMADFMLEFKVLDRDVVADKDRNRDIKVKAQLNAIVTKVGRRIIAWSDTAEARTMFGWGVPGLGFRNQHAEIKLTERFLKLQK